MSLGVAAVVAAAVVAIALMALAAWSAWGAWQRLWRTVDAAEALVDVHVGAIEARTEGTAATIAHLAATSERAAEGWSAAIAGVRELGVLGSAISSDRARLRRELLDLVLPTPVRDAADVPARDARRGRERDGGRAGAQDAHERSWRDRG